MTARHRFELQLKRIAQRPLVVRIQARRRSQPIAIIRARGIGCRLVLP